MGRGRGAGYLYKEYSCYLCFRCFSYRVFVVIVCAVIFFIVVFFIVVFTVVGFVVIVYVIDKELGILVVGSKLQTNKIIIIARLCHDILHLALTLNNDCSELPPDYNDADIIGLDPVQQSDGDGVLCNSHRQRAHLHRVRRHCHRYWYPQKKLTFHSYLTCLW